MKQHLSRVGFVGLAVALCLALMSFSAEAGVKKKVSVVLKQGPVVSRTIIYPGDALKHEMHQYVRAGDVLSSFDADFDGAIGTEYGQNDRVGGSASGRCYNVIVTKDGDQYYTKGEYTFRVRPKEGGTWEITGETLYQHIGGTGKFKNAKGDGIAKFTITPEGGTIYWEAEVEY